MVRVFTVCGSTLSVWHKYSAHILRCILAPNGVLVPLALPTKLYRHKYSARILSLHTCARIGGSINVIVSGCHFFFPQEKVTKKNSWLLYFLLKLVRRPMLCYPKIKRPQWFGYLRFVGALCLYGTSTQPTSYAAYLRQMGV
jgi:hypothetical protein